MSELPVISGRETIKALSKLGYEVVRVKGSHHVLKHPQRDQPICVQVHAQQDLPPGTLRSIIRTAGLTVDEFNSLL